MYFIGCVRLFFANNSYRNIGSPWNFYSILLDPEVIISSQTMFIDASTKEFTRVNNARPSYDVAFEHILYYKLAHPIL